MLDPALRQVVASIVLVAVLALVWGGVATWRRGDRRKGVLMAVCAVVLFGNLLIWTV